MAYDNHKHATPAGKSTTSANYTYYTSKDGLLDT